MSNYDNSNAGLRAYSKIINDMNKAFQEATGRSLPEYSDLTAIERFKKILNHYIDEIQVNKNESNNLINSLRSTSSQQPILAEMIDDGLLSAESISSTHREILVPVEIDDASPNAFKNACREEARDRSRGDVYDLPLNEFLRGVINRVGSTMGWKRRMNIGANRHFPRMVQWLRELESETACEDGNGFWLLNQSGAGRIRENPVDPSILKIRIDPAYL
ncbi:MAG TPA: hypothetical protein PLK13_02345 [Xanthobacteraceae bacterium]|nr:hypothetical protein [Xanthobacteraceae bacterium]